MQMQQSNKVWNAYHVFLGVIFVTTIRLSDPCRGKQQRGNQRNRQPFRAPPSSTRRAQKEKSASRHLFARHHAAKARPGQPTTEHVVSRVIQSGLRSGTRRVDQVESNPAWIKERADSKERAEHGASLDCGGSLDQGASQE